MKSTSFAPAAGLLLLALAVGGCDDDDAPVERVLRAGSWGGDRVELLVGADSIVIQFDCDDARAGRPAADDRGRFEVAGRYRVFGGIVFDEMDAVIRGTVAGSIVTGEIAFPGTARDPIAFEVTYGADPQFEGCLLAVASP